MSVIRLSNKVIARMLAYNSTYSPFKGTSTPYSLGSSVARFFLMQGTFPTQTELTNAIPNTFRTSDRLVEFSGLSWSYDVNNGTVNLNTQIEATASATGTATWFWIVGHATLTTTDHVSLAGSVSAIGGGGDLVMASTSITAGGLYTLNSGLAFTIPSEY